MQQDFLIVRIIIEKLANQDFESYMQEEYFDKLQLNNANFKRTLKSLK